MNIKYDIEIYFTVSLGVSCLTDNVEGKKIPRFIKKLNEFLGLPPNSNKVMDILLISGNTAKINNITGTVSKNAENIAKNTIKIQETRSFAKPDTQFRYLGIGTCQPIKGKP